MNSGRRHDEQQRAVERRARERSRAVAAIAVYSAGIDERALDRHVHAHGIADADWRRRRARAAAFRAR